MVCYGIFWSGQLIACSCMSQQFVIHCNIIKLTISAFLNSSTLFALHLPLKFHCRDFVVHKSPGLCALTGSWSHYIFLHVVNRVLKVTPIAVSNLQRFANKPFTNTRAAQ